MCRNALVIFGLWSCFVSCKQSTELNNQTLFSSLDPSNLGIDFKNDLSYDEEFNVYLYKSFYNGAGVGLGDINNDGLLDIFFCGNQVDNKVYLNKGDFKFEDVTMSTGMGSPDVWSNGVSMVDINGDGWLDIYVCKGGKPEGKNRHNELFINQGVSEKGDIPTFIESAVQYGISDVGLSVHAAFFDMDRDGDLDMYLLNNSLYPSDIVIEPREGLRNQRDPGGGNKLYRNDGNNYVDISEEAGIYGSAIGFGLGVSIGDVNRDGWQDIYVANDFFERDYLYINNQNGSFNESLVELMPESSQGAMGVDISDINNDGLPEIYVTEMLPKGDDRVKTKVLFDSWNMYSFKKKQGYHRQFPRNSFQLNNGKSGNGMDISFSEISRLSGVDATDWSWAVLMADLNNSGFKEIYITNGIYKDLIDLDYLTFHSNTRELKMTFRQKGKIITNLIDIMPSVPISNHLYTRKEDLTYEDVSKKWGTDDPGFSNGVAYGDLDNDGDLDLIVNNINMPPFIYKNNTTDISTNHFLNIALKSDGKNVDGIGGQVTLFVKGGQFFQELLPMRGSMSTVSNRLHFGLGNIDYIDSLEIIWPEGLKNYLYDIPADQFLVLSKSEPKKNSEKETKTLLNDEKYVDDISEKTNLNHLHIESEFVDFDRDILLCNMITNEGPKLAIGDVNNDGLKDVFIGGAKGFSGALYVVTKTGSFQKTNADIFERDKSSEDTDAVFVDIDNDGDEDLLVVSGSYEFSGNSFALANRIYKNDGHGNFNKFQQYIQGRKLGATSCLSVSDFDGDGDHDVFVGGRVVPSAYGVPADSYILENDGTGNFKDVTESIAPDLLKIGMVTDALWCDYDNDGDEDLFICGDWMPIRVFNNKNGFLTEHTEELGFSHTNGFWNTLKKQDLDNDGDLDLIAGNLGLNTQLKGTKNKPVSLYINDFDHDGKLDHIITVFDGEKAYPIASRGEISRQLPYLKNKYPTHEDYKGKTVEDIFSTEQLSVALKLEVFETASLVFWNENTHFTAQQLPLQVQFSPVYSILTVDVNHDGNTELLIGGNQHRAKPQTGIYAGSFGSMIKLISKHQYEVIPFSKSGFFINGEIRDMEKLTIKGEEIILVARNNDLLKIFKINQ